MDIVVGLVLRVVLGVVIGFCVGLTGIGAGVLTLLALSLVFGLPASQAVGTTSLYVFFTNAYGSYRHFRLKTVDLRTAGLFLAGAIPGNLATAAAVHRYKDHVAGDPVALRAFQQHLSIFIACVITASVVLLTANLIGKIRRSGIGAGRLAAWFKAHPRLHVAATLVIGAGVGALVGATSISGVVLTPLLIVVLGLPPNRTVGTSIFSACILMLTTVLVYSRGGDVNVYTAMTMAVGAMLGVHWGSGLTRRIPAQRLQFAIIVVILLAAVAMFLKSLLLA